MMGDGTSVLRGTVEQVVFTNQDTGWTVARLKQDAGTDLATVVGALTGASVGTRLELTGRWETNVKYGRQFRAESAVPVTPSTVEGIRAYLASGLVEGLGAGLAERLVDAFGEETLEVIEKTPDRLTEVDGIGAVRAARIQEALAPHLGLQSTMVFLHSVGLSPRLAARIHRVYRSRAATIVQTEPYRLALDVRGVGFWTADQVAAKVGVGRDSPQRAQAGLLHVLADAAQNGHVLLPRQELFRESTNLLGDETGLETGLGALVESGRVYTPDDAPNAVYAAPMYDAETQVVRNLARLLSTAAGPLVEDPEAVVRGFEATAGLELAPAQRAAVVHANTARILVVTGGPGTGKTTIVRALLAMFNQAHLKVELAAPTGRAAKRLGEATAGEARTLHRLLAYDPRQHAFAHSENYPLSADALIVDEMSMVDIPLMAALAAALPDTVRLVLVGDVDQLPSVGPGQVLRDLIDSGRIPVAQLDRIYRQQADSRIVSNAHHINAGRMPDLADAQSGSSRELQDFYLIERSSAEATQATLIKVVADRIPSSFDVHPFDDVQVLTPMHKGSLGAQVLNQRLQEHMNPTGLSIVRGDRIFRIGDKVMQTRNNYDLGTFNGDVGRLVYIDKSKQTIKVVFDEREVLYEPLHQEDLTLAYAMSIHKSQGSEYPAVVIPLTMQHFVMLHRNLLYTAVTRGKRLVVLIGDRRALRTAVERARDLRRHSRLDIRLRTHTGQNAISSATSP